MRAGVWSLEQRIQQNHYSNPINRPHIEPIMQNYYGPSLPPQPAYKDQFQTHHSTYLIPPQPPTPIETCKISLYHEIVWYISVVKMIWFILSYDWYATIRVSGLVIFLSWQSKFFSSYDKLMVKGKHVSGYILIPLNYFILVQPLPTFFFVNNPYPLNLIET